MTVMTHYTIPEEMGPDLTFIGRKLHSVSSRKNALAQRWTELEVYITEGGNYIAVEWGISLVDGERNKASTSICNSKSEIVDAFGYGWLGKKLYLALDIGVSREVA